MAFPKQDHFALLAVIGFLVSSLCLDQKSLASDEILSECICWCLILLGGKIFLRVKKVEPRPFNASKLNLLAFSTTLLCLVAFLQRASITSLAPLLCPIAIAIEEGRRYLPVYNVAEGEKQALSKIKFSTLSVYLYAFITTVILLQHDSVHSFRLNVCWLLAQFLLYRTWSQRVSPGTEDKTDNFTILHTATELATFVTCVTVPLAVLWWQNVPSIPHVAVVSILKAARWMAVIVLVHEYKLSLMAWSTVFTTCTKAIFIFPSGLYADVFLVGGALGALGSIWAILPRSDVKRWAVLAFVLFPIWGFTHENNLGSKISTAWPGNTAALPQPSVPGEKIWADAQHPIYRLAEQARTRFDETESRQSKSLKEAVAEYKKRYGRAPPPGFDAWYEFAIKNEVTWIDEYDILTKSFEPFWQLPSRVLRDHVEQAKKASRFNVLSVKNQKAKLKDGSFQHAQIVELLSPALHLLPDFDAVLNEMDEPRILPPYDVLHKPPPQNQKALESEKIQPVWWGKQEQQVVWESATLSCPPTSPARNAQLDSGVTRKMAPFVENLAEAQDICLWPAASSLHHGFLSSPSSFEFTHSLVPSFATARISTFRDLMIPSSYYFQGDISVYDESKDSAWENKKDQIYWVGTGTGGHWHHGSWRYGHRQRFVNFTNFADADIQLLDGATTPGQWKPVKAKMSAVMDKFHVKFSQFIQCDDSDCKEQAEFFGKAQRDSEGSSSTYKVLYNLDGNSFSGRYYRYLKSNSVVFMQALFQEWHDDRILPWVHFVPISVALDDLPETSRYLLDDPEGKKIAERIARDSRVWARKTLRPIDMTAAYLRAFLEYARLLDENRDALV